MPGMAVNLCLEFVQLKRTEGIVSWMSCLEARCLTESSTLQLQLAQMLSSRLRWNGVFITCLKSQGQYIKTHI